LKDRKMNKSPSGDLGVKKPGVGKCRGLKKLKRFRS
jgi:hypothetical protein